MAPAPLMMMLPATPVVPFRSTVPLAEKLYVPAKVAVVACEIVKVVAPVTAVTYEPVGMPVPKTCTPGCSPSV